MTTSRGPPCPPMAVTGGQEGLGPSARAEGSLPPRLSGESANFQDEDPGNSQMTLLGATAEMAGLASTALSSRV